MKSLFILPFLLITISCSNSRHKPNLDKKDSIEYEIDTLVSAIAAENRLNDEGIGIGWKENSQWKRFYRLSQIATEEELITLTDHPNAVVRGYSFQALAKKNSDQTFPILIKHLTDTATVITFSGCFQTEDKLANYLIEVVTPNLVDSDMYKLNKREQATVDSILLFDKSIHSLYARTRLLEEIKTDKKYYNRIRELAIENNEKVSVPVLAKYRNANDKQIIIDKLKSSERTDWYYALMAVRNFPDPAFFPYVEKLYKFEMTDKTGLTISGIRMLYQAIVQYKNKASRDLIQRTLSDQSRTDLSDHYEYIYLALKKYPHKIYHGLIDQIKLTDFQMNNVKNSMDDNF